MSIRAEHLLLWIIRGAVGATLFLPLLFIPQTFYPFIFPKVIFFRICAEIAAAAWIILALYRPHYRPSFSNPLLLSLTIFVGIALLTMFFGIDPTRSFWSTQERMTGVLTLIHLWLFVVICAGVFTRWVEWELLILISLGVSLVVLGLGVARMLGGVDVFESTMGNRIYMAVYAGMHVFLAPILIARRRERFFRCILFVLMVVNGGAVLFAGSRGALLALIVGTTVFGLSASLFAIKKDRKKILKAITSVCIVFLGLIVLAGIVRTSVDRGVTERIFPLTLVRLVYGSSTSDKDRLTLWGIGLQGFAERPFFGWGWENFFAVYERHLAVRPYMNPWYDRSHNQLVDVLVFTGIVGFLAYLFLWIAIIRGLVTVTHRARDRSQWIVGSSLGGLFAFYFIQNLTIFDSPVTLILFFLLIAFLYFLTHDTIQSTRRSKQDERRFPFWVWSMIVGGACVGAIIYFNGIPFLKSINGVKALSVLSQNPLRAPAAVHSALSGSWFTNGEIIVQITRQLQGPFFSPSFPLPPPQRIALLKFLITRTEEELKGHADQNAVQQAIALLSLYRKLYFFEKDSTLLDRAEELFKRFQMASPRRWYLYEQAAYIALFRNDSKNAEILFSQGITHANDSEKGTLYWKLAQVASTAGDSRLALDSLIRADENNYPIYSDPGVAAALARHITPELARTPIAIYIERVALTHPGDVEALVARMVVYRVSGNAEAGELFLKELKEKNPDLADEVRMRAEKKRSQ